VDEAIRLQPALEDFLGQRKDEVAHIGEGYRKLAAILEGGGG
jgi:flagellum-specific ATP synthase